METSDLIAFLALLVSFGAFGWNIIRDLIVDKTKVDVEASAGGTFMIKGIPNKGVFISAGSEPEGKVADPQVAFFITNTGRRPIVIEKICGEYKKGLKKPFWFLNTRELPKMIQPYERLVEIADSLEFINELKDGKVTRIWVQDTKGKRWYIDRKKLKKLHETVSQLKLS
jgi:hypothetical protein